jgi:hypothetical protein
MEISREDQPVPVKANIFKPGLEPNAGISGSSALVQLLAPNTILPAMLLPLSAASWVRVTEFSTKLKPLEVT